LQADLIRLGFPSHGWALKRVMHGDVDITDTPSISRMGGASPASTLC
jgi:hypothetical protein